MLECSRADGQLLKADFSCFLGRADLDTGTIVEPSIATLVVSEIGSPKFSGRSSDSSKYWWERILGLILLGFRHDQGQG